MRHAGGTNIVAHRPRNILQVTQADHWLLAVQAASPRISLKRLSGA
ncbi:hypothetical protein ACFQU7_33755 [Pseudoroseomonas wenyumeiae]